MDDVDVIDISYHRNGITGKGFHIVLFDDEEHGRMMGILFAECGYCAVLNINKLAEGNIALGKGNSFRGDVFESKLRPAISAYQKGEII